MIKIDGSIGEGGGQILRTALGLSLVTGEPFTIENIRAKRSKPGLLRQHLTAVEAATKIGDAKVDGNVIGSQKLTFYPGEVTAGEYHFSVGTAGSATLVLQTILPALMIADSPSIIVIEGGTHNPFAPPVDFLKIVFAPILKQMGVDLEVTLHRHGFYPAGGGKIEAKIVPIKKLKPIFLLERGKLKGIKARSLFAQIPGNVAVREIAVAKKHFSLEDDQSEIFQAMDSQGPGNIFTVEVDSENIREMFVGFGELRKSAEAVAHEAIEQVKKYLQIDAPVGTYLADQLLIPFALAKGGEFKTTALTLHSLTNAEIIEKFMDVKINFVDLGNGQCHVSI
ncbi:MAG: RNA 3'-terminal phosphate cyclase [Candidatus Omnitrophica bacterium]|nr:RNA 3'-terminal phosphate cyclase [Candidatus Omnitrophota bacterium]